MNLRRAQRSGGGPCEGSALPTEPTARANAPHSSNAPRPPSSEMRAWIIARAAITRRVASPAVMGRPTSAVKRSAYAATTAAKAEHRNIPPCRGRDQATPAARTPSGSRGRASVKPRRRFHGYPLDPRVTPTKLDDRRSVWSEAESPTFLPSSEQTVHAPDSNSGIPNLRQVFAAVTCITSASKLWLSQLIA